MCNVDTTPVSWGIDKHAHVPMPQLPLRKTCRNMHAIDEWALERDVGEVDFGFGPDHDV